MPDRRQRSCPKDLADHGGVMQQRLPVGRERVEARGDRRLDGLGDRDLSIGDFAKHPGALLRVERVAIGALQQRSFGVGRKGGSVEQDRDQSLRLLLAERRERECGRVSFPTAPAGLELEELRSRRAQDEERNAG